MSDYSELKRMAEAAPEGPWFGPEYAPGTSYVFDVDLGTLLEYQSIDSEKDDCLRYVAAANPAAVLALIAENKRNQRIVLSACMSMGAIGESLGLDMDSDGDEMLGMVAELKAERDQLKAENEALRKDADRYRWLRNDMNDVAITFGVHSWEDLSGEFMDSAIDAAMFQGEKP